MADRYYTLTLVRHAETLNNASRVIMGQTDSELSECGVRQATALGTWLADLFGAHNAGRWPYDAAYASDLGRAVRTFDIAAERCGCEAPATQWPVLRERAWGELEGRPSAELHEAARREGLSAAQYTVPGAETPQQLRSRAVQFARDLHAAMRARRQPDAAAADADDRRRFMSSADWPAVVAAGSTGTPTPAAELDSMRPAGHAVAVSHGGLIRELQHYLFKELHCAVSQSVGSYEPAVAFDIFPNTAFSRYAVSLNSDRVHQCKFVCLDFNLTRHLDA